MTVSQAEFVKSGEMRRNDEGIKRLGTYMLKGWVMTDEPCRNAGCNVPTVRTKDRSIVRFCVLCDDKDHPYPTVPASVVPNVKEDESEPNVSSSWDVADEAIEVRPASAEDPARAELRRRQGERASQLLGQKLLSGWALLDEICPGNTCFAIPLVRNRQKQKYCVICERTYSEEQSASQQSSSTETSSTPTITPVASTTDCASTQAPRMERSAPSPPTQIEKLHRTNYQRSSACKRRKIDLETDSVTSTQREPVQAENASLDKSDFDSLMAQKFLTVTTLEERMESLRRDLEGARSALDIKVICDAIASCAAAIVACQGIKSH
ncbi:hypothetical protein HDU85_000042 [Gaertneriomyces sp. JEL0708]|nr:hypothetical protein HDU85_000042 [Gaertneriomyces sp. JEL0708]